MTKSEQLAQFKLLWAEKLKSYGVAGLPDAGMVLDLAGSFNSNETVVEALASNNTALQYALQGVFPNDGNQYAKDIQDIAKQVTGVINTATGSGTSSGSGSGSNGSGSNLTCEPAKLFGMDEKLVYAGGAALGGLVLGMLIFKK